MHLAKHDWWDVLDDAWGGGLGLADRGVPAAWFPVVTLVQPQPTPGVPAPQLYPYNYGVTDIYGSNVASAWSYSTGVGVTVALLDDGFDPVATSLYVNFSVSLSRNFGAPELHSCALYPI